MAGKPKAPELVKTYMLRIRMTDADRELIEAAARLRSLETSTWARSELVALARAQIVRGDGQKARGRPPKRG
jgi:uncharacterized protein (DUF1778 family)